MKKLTGGFLCIVFILSVIVFASCASGASFMGSKAKVTEMQKKEWILQGIRSGGKTVVIDRKKLEAINMGGAFTLNFDEDSHGNEGRVNGAGAPNRYFGTYTIDNKKGISFGEMASTKMLALVEPEELKEDEFFNYLSKASRWDIKSGKLEIYSANNAGAETVLIFESK